MLRTRLIPVLVLFLMLSVSLPISEFAELPKEVVSEYVPGNLEGYDLYLDEVGDSGGDGALTTAEPSGAHKEASILSGVEFRSDDLISDLTIYGEGSETLVRLSIYMQFKGQEGSTADLTFTLNAVGGPTYTETLSLSDPCSDGLFNSDCSWTINEIFFDVPEDGFTVDKGAQLRLQIDGSASCEGQGGIGQGGDCDVLVAYGDVEQTAGYSRVELKANALAESSVKVHTPGGLWTDGETLEWAPNHRPEFRTIQFTVDVRDAFGRADINSVSLVLSTPSGTNTVFDRTFEDDDLRLDNNGLVGNYTWTYDAGIAPGQYPLQLEIVDVQGHVVVFNHQGVEFVEHDIYLSLPVNQPDVILIAPGQVSSAEFMIEHTGSATVDMNVVFELFTTLPSSWSDPVWDQPAGYALNGGGSFARPILSIEAPEGDLSTAPEHIEVWARAYAENDEGVTEEVQVKKIILDVEEVGVYAPPRLGIWEDSEHQVQIADSNRPEAYDPLISHYIDSEEVGEFFIDVFNAGFDTDNYRLKIEDMPDGWQYVFYDNDTGQELVTEGIHAITPDIGSHEILTLVMKIYPPSSRDDADVGLVTIRCSSTGDAELNTITSFTIHRTFGILAEVISDSDGGDPGIVGPKPPGSTVSFDVRITDSTQEIGQNTWRVISPEKLTKNTDNDEVYGTWTYTLTDDNGSDVVALRMSPGDEVDITVEIKMRDKVISGNHTIYLRVTEENPDDDPRYFDLPLTIRVSEDVTPGRIFVERVTPLSSFLPNEAKHIEFQVQNDNNVPLDIIITADIIPTGWDARLTTSSNQMGGNFVLLTIEPYSKEEFTMILTAPDNIVSGNSITITLEVTPMDDEVPYDAQYTQRPSFEFTTDCTGFVCIVNFATNPTPQTIALYVGLILVVILAVYRRGQTSVAPGYDLEEMVEDELGKDLEDLPEPAISDEELDDDLELLEDLEDL
jgi:hypothetical protein